MIASHAALTTMHMRDQQILNANPMHRFFGVWIFTEMWGIFWIIVSFLLQEGLEETVEIYHPDPNLERVLVHWGVSTFLLFLYLAFEFWAFKLRQQYDVAKAIKSLPYQGKGVSGKYIIKKATQKQDEYSDDGDNEHKSAFSQHTKTIMSVHPDTGELRPPEYDFGTSIVTTLMVVLRLFTALSVTRSVSDTIQMYHPNPSHIRAALYGIMAIIGLVVFIGGNYLIPHIHKNCCQKKKDPPPSTHVGGGRLEQVGRVAMSETVSRRRMTTKQVNNELLHDTTRRNQISALVAERIGGHLDPNDVTNFLRQG